MSRESWGKGPNIRKAGARSKIEALGKDLLEESEEDVCGATRKKDLILQVE